MVRAFKTKINEHRFHFNDINSMNKATETLKKATVNKNTWFVCIGTDRSTGDCLGPLVGTFLKEQGFNVIGTVMDPIHATNIDEKLSKLPDGAFVIAIDAALGKLEDVGIISLSDGSLKPGAGVNKELAPVGDMRIIGTVNVGGFMEYFILQNTRLAVVWQIAETVKKLVAATTV